MTTNTLHSKPVLDLVFSRRMAQAVGTSMSHTATHALNIKKRFKLGKIIQETSTSR